jgi:membrane peptidoglycan carboxypeptidase
VSEHPRLTPGRALVALASLALILILGIAAVFVVAASRAPSTADLVARTRAFEHAHRVTALPLSRIAPAVREAAVATEDERFYQHSGVDLIALLRAVPFDLSHFSFAQGASTIAEQLAKVIYLGGNDHSTSRKTQDVVLGYRIGHRFRHETILDAYLNVVYLGEGQYGVMNAARHYFGRTPQRLSLNQASLLVGLIQAPSLYDPQTNPQRARSRQVDVLRSMVRNGYTTETEATTAVDRPLRLATGATLPPLADVSFAVAAPFDYAELAAALIMLLSAVVALLLARVRPPPIPKRNLIRVAAVSLLLISALTAAHSVQVL